jgi:hypothetical protein
MVLVVEVSVTKIIILLSHETSEQFPVMIECPRETPLP